MPSYYDTHNATTANSRRFLPEEGETQHFPVEGLYFGELAGGSTELPALHDLNEGRGLNIMYSDASTREQANRTIERIAWRIALTVPSNLCDMILFNGGKPGDAFTSLSRMNKYLFGNREDKLFYDGNLQEFSALLQDVYKSINERMQIVNMEGKSSLYELNESLGTDAKLKYTFILLTDFPVNLTPELGAILSKIVESGPRAGVYVMMTWDINGDFATSSQAQGLFSPQKMLSSMISIIPKGGRFYFKNSSNDAAYNRFTLVLDSSPVGHISANEYLDKIEELVGKAKKSSKPKALKQDFAALRDNDYVPAMKDISVTVGEDIHDKHVVSFSFMSKDFIHGFVLGQSGSGKSVLLNNIITSAILKYSPQDLMLYLMDFKGVEFNAYRGLKHTKAVLVDSSDPQMTLEVLRELYEEDKKRRKLWVSEEVKSIDGYNAKHPDKRLPQIVFVADECQVMFKQPSNDSERIALREITEILVHIAKIGRSQGIHMLLATQQLGEVNIHNDILENLTECFILRSAARDSERLVPGSSGMTEMQDTGVACYFHQKKLQGQVQTYYATDNEQRQAIADAQQKASDVPGNGAHYFSGSAEFSLSDEDERLLVNSAPIKYPTAFVGRNIGIHGNLTTIPLNRDFSENILMIGVNKEEQTSGVAISALQSLAMSIERLGKRYDIKVIDCYSNEGLRYRVALDKMQTDGLCEIIERTESGAMLKQLANDINKQMAMPTLLVILGSERFAEMKRKSPLESMGASKITFNVSSSLFSSVMDLTPVSCDFNTEETFEEQQARIAAEQLVRKQQEEEQANKVDVTQNNAEEEKKEEEKELVNTYPEALRYILDEGPMQDVHVLLQADKPTNILFEDYPDQTVSMFKHKIILKSENKVLAPMRFSVDIDVECLSDERERLRAYYYPENGTPQLFTPYLL